MRLQITTMAKSLETREVPIATLDTSRGAKQRYLPVPARTAREVVSAMRKTPVIAAKQADGALVVLGGFKLIQAAMRMNLQTAVVRVVDVRPEAWLATQATYNVQYGESDAISQASLLSAAINAGNVNTSQFAEATGLARSTVANLLRLLTLEAEVQDMVASGLLSTSRAKLLVGLDRENQLHAAMHTRDGKLDVRTVAQMRKGGATDPEAVMRAEAAKVAEQQSAAAAKRSGQQAAVGERQRREDERVSQRLSDILTAEATIKTNHDAADGSGVLSIKYGSSAELNALLELLGYGEED